MNEVSPKIQLSILGTQWHYSRPDERTVTERVRKWIVSHCHSLYAPPLLAYSRAQQAFDIQGTVVENWVEY